MSRIVGLLPGSQVTTRVAAIIWLNCQIVVAINVASGAGGNFARGCELVRIGKRETCTGVIKNAVRPKGDGVASGASGGSGGEICRNVVRYIAAKRLRAEPCCLVAAHAIRRTQCVIVVDVAGHAGSGRGRHVGARQSEAGRRVIERRYVGPRNRVVASGAIRDGKLGTSAGVCRIIGLLPSREMASGIAAIGGLDR